MEAKELLLERRSIRKYKDQKVDRELLREIVEIAKFAPSWKNYQIARYTFVDDEEIIKRLATEAVNGFIYNTKTLENAKGVVVLSYVNGLSGKLDDGNYGTSKANSWEVFDAGIAAHQFCLAAHTKGIGTVIMGVIADKEISEIVNLPVNETVAALIVYGYPEGPGRPVGRMEVDELIRFI
ncbi:nitroreductase family protein [Mycoplasmatota bacterium]|nr:nitroreductase family protein [Mycoplasmatota bacterium]